MQGLFWHYGEKRDKSEPSEHCINDGKYVK